MEDKRQLWASLAQNLHQWGVQEAVATFLEAAGPLSFLGAQIIYLTQPILDSFSTKEYFNDQLSALAHLLEEPSEMHDFLRYLREECQQ